jgi:recombination protein RecR
MHFSSTLIEKGVEAFSSLPGIGKKTALRLVLYLLKQDNTFTERFSDALLKMRRDIRTCDQCHNLSDDPICRICTDQRRDSSLVCVVENIRDLMAIEDTGQFRGVYHVLGGVISPIDGIGPDELTIERLVARCEHGGIQEVIMAISPTIEGETTVFYLAKRIKPLGVQVSSIARGVAFGGDLEYADEITLGRSIIARTPYGD